MANKAGVSSCGCDDTIIFSIFSKFKKSSKASYLSFDFKKLFNHLWQIFT